MLSLIYFPAICQLTAALRPADVGAGAEPEDHPLRLRAALEVAGRLLAPLGAVAAARRVREGVDALEGARRRRRLRPDAEHEELRSQNRFNKVALQNDLTRGRMETKQQLI